MAEYIAAGDRAFVDEEYEDALQHYTKSLEAAPSAAAYEARANANIKLERYMEAVQDATKALELDANNAKAFLRKGTACFYLEEYETALQAFERGQQLAAADPKFPKWIRRCKAELDASEGHEVVAPPAAAVPAPAAPAPAAASPAPAPAAAASPAPPPPPAAPAPAAAPSSSSSSSRQALAPAAPEGYVGKYRYQWYQLGPKVVLDVYAKNQPRDAVNVALSGDDRLRITIAAPPQQQQQQQPAGSGEAGAEQQQQQQEAPGQQEEQAEQEYVLELELFDKVAADVKVEVLKTKVEITLLKANPSSLWKSLERSAAGPAAAGVGAAAAGAAAAPAAAAAGPPRAYPSSKGGKDWSKVEAEVKEMEDKGELDDADPLGAFFKKIFAQGDEDTRRAMMKSFVESNGTVLSTNWKEVGAKPVECTPPEGMELHKWNEP